jgi:hypothetical protein
MRLLIWLFFMGWVFSCCAFLQADPPVDSPSVVVKSYYWALNKGNNDEIKPFYAKEFWVHVATLPPDFQHIEGGYDRVTGKRTITIIDTTKENIQGDRAWVNVTIHYQSLPNQNYSCGVVKEDGKWKVTWN